MGSRFAVKSLDHVVLTVRSIPATVEFYTRRLGMKHEVFTSAKDPGVERHALLFGNQKINLHQSGHKFEPKAQSVQPGSGDLCFLTNTKVEEVLADLKDGDVEVLEGGGIVDRTGAIGKLRSAYCRDSRRQPHRNIKQCLSRGHLSKVEDYCLTKPGGASGEQTGLGYPS